MPDISRSIGIGDVAPLPLIQADKKMRLSSAKFRAGAQNFVIAIEGSSTPRGVGAGYESGVTGNLQYPNAWPAKFAKLLRSKGIPARADAFFGTGSGTGVTDLTAFDNRVSQTGNWYTQAVSTLGGRKLRATAAAIHTVAPDQEFDRFSVCWEQFNTAGSATVKVDGVAVGTIDRNTGGSGPSWTVFSTTLGVHTITIEWATGAFGFVAIRPYCSAKREVEILNFGVSGSSITDTMFDPALVGNTVRAYDVLASISRIDLFVFDRGRNEWTDAVGVQAMVDRMNTYAALAESLGASGLVVTPQQTSNYDAQNGAAYTAAQVAFAQARGWGVVDYNTRLGAYASATGFTALDGTHLNDYGHQDRAEAVLATVFG